jgi:DNA polymerase III delta prime subunit
MSTPDPQSLQRIEHSSIQGSKIQQGQAGKDLTQIQTEQLTQVDVSVFGRDRRTNAEKLRLDLADQILKNHIQPELKQRLQNTVYQDVWLNPELEEQPHQVGELVPNRLVQVAGKPAETLDLQTTILEVFTSHRRLLILGEPGIGKTTTLLTLADQLVEQAIANPGTAIPIIFELSTWKKEDQSIEAWLIQQLTKTYRRVSAKIAQDWLKEELLIPLLDGLDEINSEHQENCRQLLNKFAEHYPYLVVCCRAEEYEAGTLKLDELRSAVRLQPLTPIQIQEYLQQVGRRSLWEAVATHPEKQVFLQPDTEGKPGILQIPLFLRIVAEVGKPFMSQAELLETYIDQRLSRDMVDWERRRFKDKPWAYRSAYREPSRQRTNYYLSWLALYMKCKKSAEFMIEEIALDWWVGSAILNSVYYLYYRVNRSKGRVGVGSIYHVGSIYSALWLSMTGIPMGLSLFLSEKSLNPDGHLLSAIFKGLFGVATCGVLISLMSLYATYLRLERPQYRIDYRRSKSIIAIIFFILTSITIFSFAGYLDWLMIMENNNSANLLVHILKISSSGAILVVLIYIFSISIPSITPIPFIADLIKWLPQKEVWNFQPNQSIRDFFKCSLTTTICFLMLWILGTSEPSKTVGQPLSILSVVLIALPSTIFFGLMAGGMACIKHFSMRLVLFAIARVIPWDYARFLDYCVERRLLRRIGGRYRFLHRELLEHFAQKAGGVS